MRKEVAAYIEKRDGYPSSPDVSPSVLADLVKPMQPPSFDFLSAVAVRSPKPAYYLMQMPSLGLVEVLQG